MYRNERRLYAAIVYAAAALAFAVLSVIPLSALRPLEAAAYGAMAFILVAAVGFRYERRILEALRNRCFRKRDTRFLSAFADRLRFSFTTNDLIAAFRETLEVQADATVLLVDMPKRFAVYNSSSTVGTDPQVLNELIRHYDNWKDGLYFFDENLDLTTDHRRGRGFFLVQQDSHLYVFLRFQRVMEREAFAEIYAEYASFTARNETISKMFSIAALSKDWAMVAETQRSFLPSKLPAVKDLELASFFKPLVNVSGDYYDALPLDETRTLLLLGDVSGKGLAAALIMGVVMNTIRISEDKSDLSGLVRNVDAAIKGMRLEDKYTVLFIGIVDTASMVLSYVNASMADPLIVSETRAGRQIRHLKSNCSLIGILDLPEIETSEAKLLPGDVLLIASDGVTEVGQAGGEQLGDSERWIDYVTDESARPLRSFVDGLAALAEEHSGGAQLRDDLTILAAKVAGGAA